LLSPDSLYPTAITSCADEPKVPPRPVTADGSLGPRTPEAKASYTEQLHGAWGDCHDTVAATAQRKASYAEQYKRSTESPIRKFFRFGK